MSLYLLGFEEGIRVDLRVYLVHGQRDDSPLADVIPPV